MGMPGPLRRSCFTNSVATPPNPNPSCWELIKVFHYDNAYLMMVKYTGCTNFEGIKVMVYRGKYKDRLMLDPHFADNGDSPIARFKPDNDGLRLAMDFAKSL